MKKFASLIVTITMLAAASVASAADYMWYSFISTTNPSVVVDGTSQGPGKQLRLLNPTSDAATVRIGLNITSDTGALHAFEIFLASTQGGTLGNGALLGTNYDLTFGGLTGASSGTFGYASGAANGSTGLVYAFDLVFAAGQDTVNVTGDFGAAGIRKSNGDYWYGFVGANLISFASPTYGGGGLGCPPGFGCGPPGGQQDWGSVPVIAVVIPEPSTFVLLGLGAVALIRRRK